MTQTQLDRKRARVVQIAKDKLDRGAPLMGVSTWLHIQHVDLSEEASLHGLEYDGLDHDDSGRRR